MIKLSILDLSLDIHVPNADAILNDIDQYVSGYDRIVRAIHAQKDLHIVTTNNQIFNYRSIKRCIPLVSLVIGNKISNPFQTPIRYEKISKKYF